MSFFEKKIYFCKNFKNKIMEEDFQLFIDDAEENMQNAIKHLKSELLKIRAGKASPNMLDSVFVDYYGVNTPLARTANIGVSDARTIVVQAWDKTMLIPIEKAILKANLGFNPRNNGDIIIINVPVLTEERRINLVKSVKNVCENTKISIRNSRRECNEAFRDLKKEGYSEDLVKKGENEVQELTNKFVKEVENLLDKKEKDIMTV